MIDVNGFALIVMTAASALACTIAFWAGCISSQPARAEARPDMLNRAVGRRGAGRHAA